MCKDSRKERTQKRKVQKREMNAKEEGTTGWVEETKVSSPFLPFWKGEERNSNEEEIFEGKGSRV